MKILNDLRLKLEKPNWALDAELALIDTILNENPRLYEIIASDIMDLNKTVLGYPFSRKRVAIAEGADGANRLDLSRTHGDRQE